jgi:DNA repair exonuclease SbcCD ATPase subunit
MRSRETRFDRLRKAVSELVLQAEVAEQEFRNCIQRLTDAKVRAKASVRAQRVIQAVAAAVQQQVHESLAGIVTRCLDAVFDDAYEFKILFEQKRGKTEARMVFVRDEIEINPKEASSGGALDVASFALRLACLIYEKPPRRRLLILDEPFKNVNGKVHQKRVASMITTITEELGIQLVMVTDDDWLKIGKVVEVGE